MADPSVEQLYQAMLYLRDQSRNIVNPATKEGQDQIRAAINQATAGMATETTLALAQAGIDALVAKDGATGAKQDALKAVADTLATEQKLELVRLLLVDIQSKLGSVDIASMPPISGEVSVSNLPQTQQVAGEVNIGNLPDVQQVSASGPLPVSINGKIAVRMAGNNPEISSSQHAELAGTVATYSLADGASKMELYLESGYIRIRTDGQPATATTGEPLGEGFGASWAVDSVSVYFAEDSVLTVVSRQ